MKSQIKNFVQNHRAVKIAIIVGIIVVLVVTFFSFRASALDTTLEPSTCTADWEVIDISKKKTGKEKLDDTELDISKSEESIESDENDVAYEK